MLGDLPGFLAGGRVGRLLAVYYDCDLRAVSENSRSLGEARELQISKLRLTNTNKVS